MLDVLVTIGIAGVLGFLFHGLRNNKRFVKPVNRKESFELGFIFDILTAIIGAFFMLLVVAPTSMADDFGMYLIRLAIGASLGESLLVHLDSNKEKNKKKLLQDFEESLNEELEGDKDGNEE
ncbi:DUF4257 domain-containing protein (plasmid) [Alkalihalophilus sp. As8PL]|uniref:DUF4257 domain-containing protein n=1 Tax=Alkalihalophilus sp. As8PL TaxID=3237103 RepID=A0AB39BNU2_9BACI